MQDIPGAKGSSDRAETNRVRHIRFFSIETNRVREIAREEQTENGKGDGDSKRREKCGVHIPWC